MGLHLRISELAPDIDNKELCGLLSMVRVIHVYISSHVAVLMCW